MASKLAETIVDLILDDLTNRKGFGDAWDDCDEETQTVILDTWREIVDAAVLVVRQ